MDDYNGFMFMNGIGTFKKGGLFGVITDIGALTEPVFEDLDLEPEEFVKVNYKGEWGYIDEHNQFTTDEEEASYNMFLD